VNRLTDEAFFAVEIAVRAERERAHLKHGARGNSREDQPWDEKEWLPILVEEVGEVAHLLTYDADPNPRTLRKELVQVAAMASAWIAAIDEFTR
jgi:NTP pyrophosphatase (non-canonical NTP hydrolase)